MTNTTSAMAPTKKLRREDYRVACIRVIAEELAAMLPILDEKHLHPSGIDQRDVNHYIFGEIAGHNIVLNCVSRSGQGHISVAATDLRRSFSNIEFGLLIGIGGGVPSKTCDIRLGDVVVNAQEGLSGGIIHHDQGKHFPDGFEQVDFPTPPPRRLQGAVSEMRAASLTGRSRIPDIISGVAGRMSGFQRPGHEEDRLFDGMYDHIQGEPSCSRCDQQRLHRREPRHDSNPRIHYGLIASGSQVIKSASMRDSLRDRFGICCIEMEAAGLKTTLPCLVIRGISDYADSHKNNCWKMYAALSAAAYAKELLGYVPALETVSRPSGFSASAQRTTGQTGSPAVYDVLSRKTRGHHAQDFRSSIVDLLKLLELKSDPSSRKQLAEILRVGAGPPGSPTQNIALHRALMGRLRIEDDDIVIPSELMVLREGGWR